MPRKRRNNGKNRKNRGNTTNVFCTNCGRVVPKDKCIKKFTVRDIIDASSKDDIRAVQHYEEFFYPKCFNKLTYCVSCACHARIVKVRSREDRRKRNVRRVVKKQKKEEKTEN